MAWNDTKISDSADKACWKLLGFAGSVLAERYNSGQDAIVRDGETADVVRYGDTNVLYQIVDRASGDSLRLNWVGLEETE